jgi:hypothetical protein
MKIKFPKVIIEKIHNSNKEIIVRTQEEIDEYNKIMGYRKARMKRYGISATERIKGKNKDKH